MLICISTVAVRRRGPKSILTFNINLVLKWIKNTTMIRISRLRTNHGQEECEYLEELV